MALNLNINLTDESARDFCDALLDELEKCAAKFDTHAMSDRALFKEGQLDMLNQIIDYIARAKP